MVTRIAQGRKEREIDPASAALRACMADAEGDSQVSKVARERLAELQRFVETLNQWYEQMLSVPPSKIMTLIKMGSKVVNLLSLGRKEGKTP
jgi:DNA-binding transcriptional regulator GbsR (MarR family)